ALALRSSAAPQRYISTDTDRRERSGHGHGHGHDQHRPGPAAHRARPGTDRREIHPRRARPRPAPTDRRQAEGRDARRHRRADGPAGRTGRSRRSACLVTDYLVDNSVWARLATGDPRITTRLRQIERAPSLLGCRSSRSPATPPSTTPRRSPPTTTSTTSPA